VSKETAVVEKMEKPIVRPLHVLVPLIKKDLEQGREASERAGMPYYQAAGEKMLEAKGQLEHGEFGPWLTRNFELSERHARRYMEFARATSNIENGRARPFSTFSEFMREEGGDPGYGKVVRKQAWHEPVKQVINQVDTGTLNLRKAELNRIEEREAQRKLAMQLIDIGYKALATKLHPDKGGSRDAMARLNQVRDRLKQHA
jgi:hypothetical protein